MSAPTSSVAVAVVLIEVPTIELLLGNEVPDRHDTIAGVTNDDAVRVSHEQGRVVAQRAAGRRRGLPAWCCVHPVGDRIGHDESFRVALKSLVKIGSIRLRSTDRGSQSAALDPSAGWRSRESIQIGPDSLGQPRA